MARIILVLGGARSGKSEFAEELCLLSGKKVGYIATSKIYDEEMAQRVELHRKRRPNSWKVWETPSGEEEILSIAREESEIILFDCLTLYLTYWMFQLEMPKKEEDKERFLGGKVENMLKGFKEWDGTVIFVSNEVGYGVVPENSLAREFRDMSGKINSWIAQAADETYLVTCGYGIPIKKLAISPEEVIFSWK